jgi:WD40 repeat protein
MGIEPAAHDHVVWNFMYGWYAYIYDNLIIVESLNKARSQRIITLPEKLSSLALTKDFKRIICSAQYNSTRRQRAEVSESGSASDLSASSIEQGDDSDCANIYVIGGDFSIERKLEFHPRGVQAFRVSDNAKYLVSIGNLRECTVCVWDFAFGKLKASSYTLDKLNDLAIRPAPTEGHLL